MTFIQNLLGLILGRRYREKVRRNNETNLRMNRIRINRLGENIRKRAEKAKQEAIDLERNGNHAAAVEKASLAANMEKTYKNALNRLATCENLLIQGKTQKDMQEVMEALKTLIESVIKDVDVKRPLETQAYLDEADMQLVAAQEAMTDFQEGFDQETTYEQRNETGEKALAKILQEKGFVKKAEHSLEFATLPEAAKDEEQTAHREWRDQRSKMLEELAG